MRGGVLVVRKGNITACCYELSRSWWPVGGVESQKAQTPPAITDQAGSLHISRRCVNCWLERCRGAMYGNPPASCEENVQ